MKIALRESVGIHSLWKKEAEFSDWLVTEHGIALLAQELGIEIEEPTRESRPGDYPCDIVGRLVGDEDHVVVIENQFGKTNHDHLGKFLTYASVHKAMTAIWIAQQASDDHRQVIDWLNENTPPTVAFYLAELKAFRIGDSDAAPQLDVVCRPNVGQKLTNSGGSQADRERHEWRLRFWEEIHKRVSAQQQQFRLQKPSIDHWSSVSIGRSGFTISMLLTPRTHIVGIEVYVTVPWKESAFAQLLEQKEAIEAEVGEPLQWMPLPGKKSARILLERKLDPKTDANRKAVCDWFAEKLPMMYATFKDRIAGLRHPG